MSSLPAAPLRLTNYVRKFARYEYLDLSYDKPIYLDQDPLGLVRFHHPRNPKQDRWRYVDRDRQGKPCFGSNWYLSAQFFQHGFAVV